MIRGLPHFVKPDEDCIAQLRDLEEYIAEGHGQKQIVEIARDELGGCSRPRDLRARRRDDGRWAASVDLSEIPAHRGSEDRVRSRRTPANGGDERVR
jgi:hypothetical protein